MAQNIAKLDEIMGAAPVIPVIILDDVDAAIPLAKALVAGGLPALEVTLRTPNALKVVEKMASVEGAYVGTGTVRTKADIEKSIEAGAQFMVSPGAPPKLLADALEFDVPLLPGISTATEAMAAAELGYQRLKLFPAEAVGGAKLLKSFSSPLPDLKFCPTGGVSVQNARDYLSLPNVICVGGSWVVPGDVIEAGDFAHIENLAATAARLRETA
jgi:2-dehydro-3-deoxyphosphogluconate aldolase/(4S)-4-hydroxy-2-oxoglutarate aldolase